MLSLSQRILFLGCWRLQAISITPVPSMVYKMIVAGKWSNFSMLPPSQFWYWKILGVCDALIISSHMIQVSLDRGVEKRLVQLNFAAAFDRFGHRCLLHKLRSVGIGGQFLAIVSESLRDRRQRV